MRNGREAIKKGKFIRSSLPLASLEREKAKDMRTVVVGDQDEHP